MYDKIPTGKKSERRKMQVLTLSSMAIELFLIWECFHYIGCQNGVDLTNTAATYIGITMGTVIALGISWFIYNRQKKTSKQQNNLLSHIRQMEEKHELLLNRIELFEENYNKLLNNIFILEKKIDYLLEK